MRPLRNSVKRGHVEHERRPSLLGTVVDLVKPHPIVRDHLAVRVGDDRRVSRAGGRSPSTTAQMRSTLALAGRAQRDTSLHDGVHG
jgi:hypothetical protein